VIFISSEMPFLRARNSPLLAAAAAAAAARLAGSGGAGGLLLPLSISADLQLNAHPDPPPPGTVLTSQHSHNDIVIDPADPLRDSLQSLDEFAKPATKGS